MKMIKKIALNELKIMFYSPVAWLILIVFIYQFGTEFADNFNHTSDVLQFYPGYTSWLFSAGLFPKVDSTIYLYIPLMTMGLMSQELNTGSVKLLFSSPIKTRTIVLGKYFGLMGYWLIVIFLFTLLAAPCYFMFPNLDMGIVLPGILSILLLTCTYSAIGLFMSCLTTYQVIAALCTLTTLAALNYIGNMWQGVPVLKDIVNFLYIAGHAENMNMGFIKSKDILYFIIMTVLFLGLAVFYLDDMLRFRTKSEKIKRYALFTALMLLLGCLSGTRQLTLYFDTTAVKFNTISTTGQAILKKIKVPVRVTAYSNLLDTKNEKTVGIPDNRRADFQFWEPYIRFLPQLELDYVNYYASEEPVKNPLSLDSTATRTAEQNGWYIEDYLNPKQIDAVINLKPERYTFVRTIEGNGRRHFLRVFKDFMHIPTEMEIMTAFKGLLMPYPKIGFLTGNYERSIQNGEDRDYRFMTGEGSNRGALINQGFDIETIPAGSALPADIDALVIAEPLTAFSAEEITRLQSYIANGGNLVVMGGPKSQAILNPLLKNIGVTIMNGQLVEKVPGFAEDLVLTHTPLREGGDPYPFQYVNPLAMPASVALHYDTTSGYHVEKAVVTDGNTTWNKIGSIPADTAQLIYNQKNGDSHEELPVALSLTRNTRKKEQRILVIGNGDFMSNDNLDRDYRPMSLAHAAFAMDIFKWITYEKYPLVIAPPAHSRDITLNYTSAGFAKFQPYYVWSVPVAALLAGAILLLRRRRK